jgi:hypothetical protein
LANILINGTALAATMVCSVRLVAARSGKPGGRRIAP